MTPGGKNMIKPLDVLVRVAAIPHIAWSASGSILAARRRFAEALVRNPEDSALAQRMLEGLFERLEGQCQTRWTDGLGYVTSDKDTSTAA
jgi:hypothetical protein